MRYTLLELVQRILESMESDEVSTIGETPESTSVANIVKECYFDIVGELNMDEQEGLFKLDASGDNLKPVLMLVPSNVSRVQYLKYNTDELLAPSYTDVRYVTNREFLFYQEGINTDDTDVHQMDITLNGSSFKFSYHDDRWPTYYTIFDETYVVFDSYMVTEESTLTQARSLGYGSIVPGFVLSDTWVPDLDPRQFQLLLQEAKTMAFIELKQAQNPIAEKKARKNRILGQKNKNDNDPTSSNQRRYSFGRRSVFKPMEWAMRNGK